MRAHPTWILTVLPPPEFEGLLNIPGGWSRHGLPPDCGFRANVSPGSQTQAGKWREI